MVSIDDDLIIMIVEHFIVTQVDGGQATDSAK